MCNNIFGKSVSVFRTDLDLTFLVSCILKKQNTKQSLNTSLQKRRQQAQWKVIPKPLQWPSYRQVRRIQRARRSPLLAAHSGLTISSVMVALHWPLVTALQSTLSPRMVSSKVRRLASLRRQQWSPHRKSTMTRTYVLYTSIRHHLIRCFSILCFSFLAEAAVPWPQVTASSYMACLACSLA